MQQMQNDMNMGMMMKPPMMQQPNPTQPHMNMENMIGQQKPLNEADKQGQQPMH